MELGEDNNSKIPWKSRVERHFVVEDRDIYVCERESKEKYSFR